MLQQFACWKLLLVILLTFNKRCLAILCYKCDSVTLPECAMSLDGSSLPYEECKSAFSCAMTIVDSITYRGCSTNIPRGPEYYKNCEGNLCNKGVCPPGRLKCHQCNGVNCLAAPSEKPRPCLYFIENDFCYTDVVNEIEVFRGCSSDTNRIPNILSEYCEINGCNDSPAVTTLTCSKCDSAEGRGCKMDLFEVNSGSCNITTSSSCVVQQLLGHASETCFLYHNLDRIVRGCTYDSGILSLDGEHFDSCETELCNKKCLKQQKCIVCDSATDDRCKSDPSSLRTSTCQSAEASSCNACELNDGTVRRGCGVPSIGAGSSCNQCQGEGCNKLQLTKCYKCTSDESPNCSQWANPNIIGVEKCAIAGADCVSAVLMNGTTLRGCKNPQLTCNGTQSRCVTCSGNLCNEGVFPTMRLQCHHCDGRQACSDVTDERNMRPCAQYDADDACFEFESPRGTMVRGCKSDNTMFYECLLAGSACRLCAGAGCNMMPIERPAKLRCHKCSRKDIACSWQQTDLKVEACERSVKFLSMETCYIHRYADGSTSRGCSLDDDDDIDNSGENVLIQTCAGAGCNNNATVIQKCLQCRGNRSEENPCSNVIKTVESVLCRDGLLRFEERGCYTRFDGDFIERGCASDLQSNELSKCLNGEECQYCPGIECNSVINLNMAVIRNSGIKMSRVSIALLLTLFVVMFVQRKPIFIF